MVISTLRKTLLAMLILGCAQVLTAQKSTLRVKPPYQAAETQSATDIAIPDVSDGNGTVVLDAVITESGKVERVEVRRDIAGLTKPATEAVEEWKFAPATFAGKAVASRIPVAVTVRPPFPFVNPVPLPALISQSEAAIQAEFQPAEVTRAAFPKYPPTTAVAGFVVLEATLNAEGKVEDTKVLRDLPPLTAAAIEALGDWRFMPATYNGNPLASKIVLVFVFRPVIPPNP